MPSKPKLRLLFQVGPRGRLARRAAAGRLPHHQPLRSQTGTAYARGPPAAAGNEQGLSARLSHRAAGRDPDRDAQAHPLAALSGRDLRCAADPRQRPARPADRQLLHGRGRRHDQPRPGLRLRPRGRHDHRGDPHGLEQVAAPVAPRSGRDRATGPRLRGPAGHRPIPGRSRRHDQPAAVRRGAYRRQDRDRGPHRHPRTT